MKVVVKDNDGKNVAYDLKGADAAKQLKDKPFLLKEGSQYKIQLSFKCQHEIITGLFPVLRLVSLFTSVVSFFLYLLTNTNLCSGLKLQNTIYKKGIKVDKVRTSTAVFSA